MKLRTAILSVSCAACIAPGVPCSAGIRVGNLSRNYADSYNQANAMRQQALPQTAPATITADDLPVRVANSTVAEQILRGDSNASASLENLQSCSMIYPDGEFAWDRPTVGKRGIGGAGQCVAVVELRGYQMGVNGSDIVLARANLAAGDTMDCNVSDFPDAALTPDVDKVTFPADRAPTVEDVVAIMNQEQKQNAGLKIAAGAVVAGLAGNMMGKNAPGNSALLGGGEDKIASTAIGTLTGAALMAGNVYGGKVVGDTLLSAGVNATAGSVVGNMSASAGNDTILRVEDCNLPSGQTRCLWGYLVEGTVLDTTQKSAYFNISDGSTTYVCDSSGNNCITETLISIRLEEQPNQEVSEIKEQQFRLMSKRFHMVKDEETGKISFVDGVNNDGTGDYVKIVSASHPGNRTRAMIGGFSDGAFGLQKSEWTTWRNNHRNAKIYGRDSKNEPYELDTEKAQVSLDNFYPLTMGADDGALIDFDNKARLKGTLIGAGAGGAMGAFAGYQGAQKDIQERWVAESQAYKDSLLKFYCATGNRYLGAYNTNILIPGM